jgi:Tat protein translocase TatB subunit
VFEGRFPEVLIIFVVALVVLGPQKLPQVAALVGRWLGNARAMARQFRDQLEEEARNMQRPVVDPAPPEPTPPVTAQPVVTEYSATPNSSSDERGA